MGRKTQGVIVVRKSLFVIIAFVIAITASVSLLTLNSGTQKKEKTYINAMWLGYTSIENLTKSVDVIIVGEVTKIHSVAGGDVPTTTFEVSVIQSVKPKPFPEKSVLVGQIGAETDTSILEVKMNPLMKVGEKVVLFLKRGYDDKGNFNGGYGFGGPWARYIIRDNKVYSLDVAFPELFNGGALETRVNGQPLDSFLNVVSSYV